MLMERVTASTPAEFYNVGVTYPEVDKSGSEKVTPHGGRETYGVRCDACHWSVSNGPGSLQALAVAP